MNGFDLKGKVAIVTGGNGGIGLGMARGLAAAGASVAVAARDMAKSATAVSRWRPSGLRRVRWRWTSAGKPRWSRWFRRSPTASAGWTSW